MNDFRKGSLRLFRFSGINVYLHWSWFLVAAWEIGDRGHAYSSVYWNVAEYLALFLIVTIHEFGHALACRQVGGTADQIVLWPLGGLAYVNPPQRPGATLWSVTAGPLVNVVLFPILTLLTMLSGSLGWATAMPNVATLLYKLSRWNLILLIFNMLPIYPLDGGQILRSLLWFPLGRARSLMAASVIGFVGTAGLLGLAWWMQSVWTALISVFVVMNCWTGFQQAQALSRLEKLPRHAGFACPECRTAPPVGEFWTCNRCKNAFDIFRTSAVCPSCAAQFAATRCVDCGTLQPLSQWIVPAVVPQA